MLRLGSIILFLFSVFACSTSNSQNISKVIEVDEFEKQMKSDKQIVVVDLRTDKEVAKGVIPGAIQMDFYEDGFAEELSELEKSKTYLVYCGSGGRSGKTAKMMSDQEFKEVYDLKGGITAWKAKGKEVGKIK